MADGNTGADGADGESDGTGGDAGESAGRPVGERVARFLRAAIRPERVAAWLLVVAAVAGTVAIATGFGATVATNHPEATFATTYDADANALTVTHERGDPIRAGPTDALVLVVDDGQTDNARNVTWVSDGSDRFPVEPGDAFVVDDPTVDADGDGNYFDGDETVGFELDAGDAVRVVWRGRPLGAPARVSVTLGEFTVGEG